jgi:hypothetical protein
VKRRNASSRKRTVVERTVPTKSTT